MGKGLEALESLMKDYYEMCLDTGNNDDEYQRNNLTSEYHIIEKELKAFEFIKEARILSVFQDINGIYYLHFNNIDIEIPKETYDLLKEVLL